MRPDLHPPPDGPAPPTPGVTAPAVGWSASVVAELGEVLANTAINAEYRHMVVRCSPEAAAAKSGQFFQILCPQPPGEQPYLRRPMSLYGADIMGPLGVGFTLDPAWTHVVAVGRGAGLATLAPLAREARKLGIKVTAVFSARRPDLVLSVDLFEREGATVIPVTDTEGTSGPAHVERILRGLIADGRCQAFFTCGSSRLMRVQQRLAIEFGLPGQVAMEQQMACGIGLCYCCVRDFNVGGEIVHRRVCWDGPVFDIAEAIP